MSGKGIYFFVVILLFAIFAGLNLNNQVSVNLGFKVFDNIPVFLFALFSFLVGFLFTVPFFISSSKKSRTKENKRTEKTTYEPISVGSSTINGIQEVELKGDKKGWLEKLKEKRKNDENKK